MALEAVTEEGYLRIATIAEALVEQFGVDAVRVAERQVEEASGEAAGHWDAILRCLHARAEAPLAL